MDVRPNWMAMIGVTLAGAMILLALVAAVCDAKYGGCIVSGEALIAQH